MKTTSADLFCGAGGFSAGLIQACRSLNRTTDLLAVNHWPKAIATHKLNHPGVDHLCENLDNVDPRKAIKNGRLEILLASPECTHHSNARGGKPMSDQSRASAWHVLRWAEALRVESIVVENVKEFQSWGPLNAKGRPMESKKGELFRVFLDGLVALGYKVDYRVLNSADYGAATKRERLFIQAVRRRRPVWPEKSHCDPNKERGLFDGATPYRAAREVIDWSLEGQSIFGRKKPLADKTLARIMAGLKKFGGVEFVLGQQSCAAPRDVKNPLPTISTAGAISLVQPFLVNMRHFGDDGHARRCQSLEKPMPTVTGAGAFGMCQPFIVPVTHGGGAERVYSLDMPLPTITCAQRGEMAIIEPFILPPEGYYRGNAPRSLSAPLQTITQRGGGSLVEPFVVPYYGTGTPSSCQEPLATITTVDRFGLCEPEPVAVFERDGQQFALLDIRFRMLQPHELASAMGMEGYQFTGTKSDSTKMIGNAVEVNTARALCRAVLQ